MVLGCGSSGNGDKGNPKQMDGSSGSTQNDSGASSKPGSGSVGGAGSAQLGADCPAGEASPTDSGPDGVEFLDGVTVETLVGGSDPGTDDGDASTATLANPVSIVRVSGSTFAVADYDSALIRSVSAEGTVTTVPTADGFSQPYGLSVVDGTLLAQTDVNAEGEKDPESGTLWQVKFPSGPAAVFAENLGRPRALVQMSSGTIVLADFNHSVIESLDETSKTRVIAGAADCAGFADGKGTAAMFNGPAGVVERSDHSLVVSDTGNHRLRLVSTDGTVSTLAGDGTAATVDGPSASASFVRPRALAIDSNDNVYVSDDGAHRIRRVDSSGNVVTIAGAGGNVNGFADGPGSKALFAGQEGIALSDDGKTLYVADGNGGTEDPTQTAYHRIRRVKLP